MQISTKSKRKIRVCAICKKEFHGKYSGRKGNIVCSETCRRELISQSKRKGKYIKCKQCNKEFWVKPSRLKRGVKYCSFDCLSISRQKKRTTIICEYCGKEFEVTSAHKETAKYCCKECHNKGQINRVMIPCTICGVEIERIPSRLKASKAHLCSDKCYKQYFLERIVFFQKSCDTKPEIMFDEQTPGFIDKTSSGKYYVNFKNGRIKNPDFIVRPVNSTKKVIEIFGHYWHEPEEENEIIRLYKEVGYDCLVIWENEVYENTYHEKLQSFLQSVPS